MGSPKPLGSTKRLVATQPASRVLELDVLRGVALLGVLLVNIYEAWLAEPAGGLDDGTVWMTNFFLQNKFWPLFSFLFGLGFAIQLERAAARRAPIFWIHLRRMAGLYVFGLILLVLFAGNPILVQYALLGTLLLPFQRLSPRGVLMAAAPVLAFAVVARPLWVADYRRDPPAPQAQVQPASPDPGVASPASEPEPTLWTATVDSFRRAITPRNPLTLWLAGMAELFTMFLVGLYVGKRRIYARLVDYRAQLVRTVWVGLALGFTGTAVAMATADWPKLGLGGMLMSNLARCLGGDLQSMGYAAGITLLVGSFGAGSATHLLALAGRMPLTNYLAQWLLMRILFDRFFIGLEGSVGPALGMAVAALIFVVQLRWSRWWLVRFRLGPTEWLWKSFAYLRPQPLRAT